MPMKKKGQQSSEESVLPSDQPGTSRDATEQAGQNLPSEENSRVTLVPQPKKVSYSTELFSTWRDIRWFQIPLSSLRRPKAGVFNFRFQYSLQEYQQLRKTKRLKVGRPFSVLPFPSLSVTLRDCCQETLYKKHGRHSTTGRVKRCKSSLARRAAAVPARPQHHLQPDHQCLTVLPTTDPCDCEDRNIATAQNPAVGASGGNCTSVHWVTPKQPCVVLCRSHQPYWNCCLWKKMSHIPPSSQHCLWSPGHFKSHFSSTLQATDVGGSESCRSAKAQIPGVNADQVNSTFTQRVVLEPSSMQPRVLLHRICLAQDRYKTSQEQDEPRPTDDQSQIEKLIHVQPRVLLHRISLVQSQRKTAVEDWVEPRPCDNQSCSEELPLMQPRVLLHRVCLNHCKVASENRVVPRPQDNQSSAEELNPMLPHVLLHRLCLDQCKAAAKDRGVSGSQDYQPQVEELNPKQPHVLLHRLCLDQFKLATKNRDEPRFPDPQSEAEKLIPVQPRVLLCRSSVAQDSQATSQRIRSRQQKCRSPACSLSERLMFCSEHSKQRKKRETKSRYRKEDKQAAHGHSEQGLALDPPAHSHLLSSGCPLMDTTGSGEDTSAWGSADSPLQEVEGDMFPADWTPPRIEFLYHDDPPPLSPLPEPASDSRSSGEMPDITEEVFGPQKFTDEMTSSTQSPLEILNKIAVTQLETETRDVAGPGLFASSFCQSAKEELEGALLVDQTSPPNWTTFRSECSPLPSSIHLSSPASRSSSRNIIPFTDFAENPDKLNLELNLTGEVDLECLPSPYHYHPSAATSIISLGSSISASSDKFVGDLEEQMFDSDVERDMGPESLPSQLPTHPLLESTKISSRSSISSSSDEFVGDPLKMTLDTDVERDMDPEFSLSQLPTHPLLESTKISSRSSISSSSDEFVGDPLKMTLDTDVERDMDPEFSPSRLPTHPLMMEEDIDDVEEDIDDSGLISLRDLLQTDDMNQSAMEPSTFLYSGPDGYLSSLDKLLEEKREQIREDEELERSLGEKLLLCSSLHSVEVVEESAATLPEAHRLLLKRFSISLGTIPAVHPGESIFGLLPYQKTSLALDTAGLTPQNQLENLFFSSQLDQQMVLLQDGFLMFLYGGGKYHCPCPVRRWLFQVMTLNPEVSTDAFHALWEITVCQISCNDVVCTDLWFPKLKDVTQAFYHLGACAFSLYPAGLVPLEFRPQEFSEHLLEFSEMKTHSLHQKSSGHFSLAAMLGNIFKFLTLCVASNPDAYPDGQRLALLALLCRLSLDRSLRKQPFLELYQLLLVLLEGIQAWQEKLQELCKSLCHASQHHHNLVAVMRLFPDTTDRGRQLRRNLSLCFIAKLLGKADMATSPWQEEIQLQQLGHLLPLMKPAFLKQNLQRLQKRQHGKEQQEALTELDQEACYLCYSLLTLASVVVGTQVMPWSKQGPLQHLCIQLQQHIDASIREDPCLMYRTELKNLVAQTYIKWQELLSATWLQGES